MGRVWTDVVSVACILTGATVASVVTLAALDRQERAPAGQGSEVVVVVDVDRVVRVRMEHARARMEEAQARMEEEVVRLERELARLDGETGR